MDFNDLFSKYINDASFKEEANNAFFNNSYDEFAKKYDISYTYDELSDLVQTKAESSNCDSEDNFYKLGLTPVYDYGQQTYYHPIITGASNKCKLTSNDCVCYNCDYWKVNLPWIGYCRARSREHDEA